MQRVVLATANPGKVRELAEQMSPLGFEIIAQTQLNVHSVAETGYTFIENALLKARHAVAMTGLPAIADDAGLTVDALQGAPGLYSARYAGAKATDSDNNSKLLQLLQQVAPAERTAQFHAVVVYLRHMNDPCPLIGQGIWHGVITDKATGCQGFGYDELFYLPSLGCTAAQLTLAQKNRYSHRGQALGQLLAQLANA